MAEDITKDLNPFGTPDHRHTNTDSLKLPTKFLSRGTIGAYDFRTSDITIDGAWHDLDLTNIVSIKAKAVCIAGFWRGYANQYMYFREKGNTDEVVNPIVRTQVDSIGIQGTITVPVNQGFIQYKTNIYNVIDMNIVGWWE